MSLPVMTIIALVVQEHLNEDVCSCTARAMLREYQESGTTRVLSCHIVGASWIRMLSESQFSPVV